MSADEPVLRSVNSRSPNPQRTWCVVGGGFLGMTLALRLAQGGQKVRIVEASTELGGLASAWEIGDIKWDRHYHVTLLSDSFTRGLLRELDIEDQVQWVETKTGFYANNQLHSLSNSVEYLKLPSLGWIDKFRLAATIVYGSKVSNWRRLEKIPVRDWLIKLSGQRTFNRLWLPLLRAKLGENYTRASAAFIWATISRLYAARRTGLKKEMFGYVRGGYDHTISRFVEALKQHDVQMDCGRAVDRIASRASGIDVSFVDGEVEHFDEVVVTTSCQIARHLCGELSDKEQRALDDIQYMGIICASVLLKKPLADYYLTYLTEPWVPFTAVVEMSAMVAPSHLNGHHLVYLPKYVDSRDPVCQSSDAEIEAEFLQALERIYPHFCRSDVKAFRVSRVRDVFAIPTLNYSTKVPPLETSVPHLYLANSAQIVNGTLNVNETVQLAESTARKLLATLADPRSDRNAKADLRKVPTGA